MRNETLPYRFFIISPGQVPPEPALGIEVTDATLARLCALGNIDPQHGDQSIVGALAAIEAALDFRLPPQGASLVTLRPDCDAIGAMAILAFRARGQDVTPDMRKRVSRIAEMDRHERGPWIGPRPLPVRVDDLASDWPGGDLSALSSMAFDRKIALDKRVEAMIAWLQTGMVPPGHADALQKRQLALVSSLLNGSTQVKPAESGGFAQVISAQQGALQLGYRLFDTVLCSNPEHRFHGGEVGFKHTLARWSGRGLGPFIRAIALHEKGWGGQPGIVGSPQTAPSCLAPQEVATILSGVLKKRVEPDPG